MVRERGLIRPSFYQRHKAYIITFFILTTLVLWFSSKPRRNETPHPYLAKHVRKVNVSPSDGVVSSKCSSNQNIPNMESDPPNSTFYDDPSLSYSIEEPMFDWDQKRREWLDHHPSFKTGVKERVLLLTGSQPSPCSSPTGDHFLLRFFKNKVDYCRIHGYDIYYGNTFLQPKMNSYWAKSPLIRAAMIAHPEAEWIWWVDSDAVITDMEFKLPLRRYDDYNLVVHGWPHLVYGNNKSWCGINAGVFLIRNNQWSIDLLDSWANMGPMSPDFEKWGEIELATLPDKAYTNSDDQSALITLLAREEEKWANKVFIEGDYVFQGYWIGIVDILDNITSRYAELEKEVYWFRRRYAEKEVEIYAHLKEAYLKTAGYWGKDSWRRPFITHFTGCQPCSGNHNPEYQGDSCNIGMEKALNFADKQVLRNYGFMRKDIRNVATSRVFAVPSDLLL